MLPYTKKVLELFLNPKNVGVIEDADATATEGSPACGDMVKMYLKINPQTHIIEDIKFQSYGCASNIATASIVTEMVKGKTLEEAKKITWQDAVKELEGLPTVKIHCAVLAVDALHTAIENYEHTHNLLKEKKPTDINLIRKRLSHVINPITGRPITEGDWIKEINLENGVVTISLNLSEEHQFAGAIKEEIKERLEPLWDIKEVIVRFLEEVRE